MRILQNVALGLIALIPLRAADPVTPVLWDVAKTKQLIQQAKGAFNQTTGMGVARMMDSAFLVYREKTSQGEAHAGQADYLVINDGEGTILVGGKIVNGQTSRAGETRGDSIEGGTPYPVKTGDFLYVPKAVAHQFQVAPGKFIVYTVVKITPVE